jgi:hypothetical protein
MKTKIILYVVLGILVFLIGILAGIQIGTYAVIDHVVYGLAGSTFIVDVNETRLVDYTLQKFNETILPNLKEKEK